MEIHLTWLLDQTYVACVDVSFVVVGLDTPSDPYEHRFHAPPVRCRESVTQPPERGTYGCLESVRPRQIASS